MIAAVIPTRYAPPDLGHLVAALATDGVLVVVVPSSEYEHAIYRMWNEGVRLARAAGATEIAVLNDDVWLPKGALPFLAGALRSADDVGVVYPDVTWDGELPQHIALTSTSGTWGAGGMTGFAFMFRAEIVQPFDEAFHWWYGDDAFERGVREQGWRVCRVNGVGCRHQANGSAGKDWDRLAPLIQQDRERWDAA